MNSILKENTNGEIFNECSENIHNLTKQQLLNRDSFAGLSAIAYGLLAVADAINTLAAVTESK